jgi:hypothetical protein
MNTTASVPRFARETSRGGELGLAEPLPPTVTAVEEIADRVEQHRRVAARVSEQRRKIVEASRALEQAKIAHAEKVEEGALAGKSPPRAQGIASAEKRLETAEDELRGFVAVLPKAATNLLRSAWPYLGRARDLVAEEEERALERARELLSALDSALERLQMLADEGYWLDTADGSRRTIEPFRARGGDKRVGQLRFALRQSFDEFMAKRAETNAELERIAAYEREHADEWRRQEEEARRRAEEERVVIEPGRGIVAKGGKPVKRGAFGVEPIEEQPGAAGEFQGGEDER